MWCWCGCRGISYDKLGHFGEAVQDFNKVLQLEPNNSVAYFNRGSTYDSLGMHDAAIADFSKALELDPGTSSSPVHDPAAMAAAGPSMGLSPHDGMGHSLYSPQGGHEAAAAPWLTSHPQQQWLPSGNDSGGGLSAGRLGQQQYRT